MYGGILMFLVSCNNTEKSDIASNDENLVSKWTETEVLHQKYNAERKWKDSIKCISFQDNFNQQQKDSIIKYWAEQPEGLMKITSGLIEGK